MVSDTKTSSLLFCTFGIMKFIDRICYVSCIFGTLAAWFLCLNMSIGLKMKEPFIICIIYLIDTVSVD